MHRILCCAEDQTQYGTQLSSATLCEATQYAIPYGNFYPREIFSSMFAIILFFFNLFYLILAFASFFSQPFNFLHVQNVCMFILM